MRFRGTRPIPVRRRAAAVTLIEVLLATGLLVMLSSMTFWFYSSALRTRESDTRAAQKLQLMRITLHRIATEIRQASQITTSGRVGIRGEAERIWLSTLRTPSRMIAELPPGEDDFGPRETDLVKIEYRIARHPDIKDEEEGYPIALGLARVEHSIPRPDSNQLGGRLQEILGSQAIPEEVTQEEEDDPLFEDEEAQGGLGLVDEIQWEQLYSKDIRFLRFCYYDGYKWWDDWDITGENPLPQLVQMTLGFEDHPPLDSEFGTLEEDAEEFCTCMNREPMDCVPLPADQFTMVVRIPQADPLFRSRVGREMKSLLDQTGTGEEDPKAAEGDSTKTPKNPAGASGGTSRTGGQTGKGSR